MRGLFDKRQTVPMTGIATDMSAGVKLLVTAVVAVTALVVSGPVGQGVLFVLTTAYALLIKRPKLMLALYLLMVLMMGLAALMAQGVQWVMPGMGSNTLSGLIIPFLRGLSMMNVVLVLALTTRVEELLSTLEGWHLPFWLFFPVSVMLRFIPTFFRDMQQVWEALRIRGWPVGVKMMFFHPLWSVRLVMIPVLFRALKTSETLGVSAELKGIGVGYRASGLQPRRRYTLDVWACTGLIVSVGLVALSEWQFGALFPTIGRSMM